MSEHKDLSDLAIEAQELVEAARQLLLWEEELGGVGVVVLPSAPAELQSKNERGTA